MAPDLNKLQDEAVKSIASVSTLLRNAIAASLPVAPEQYLTISIPGTVIDLEDYDSGGSFVYDIRKHAVAPTTVRQSEARLVDGMIPIANIMIGNTGKSVARSYSRALDGLIPAKATISSGRGVRSPGQKGYDDAMAFLKTKEGGKSIVDIYVQKQLTWGKARAEWDTAKIEAQSKAEKLFPPSSGPDYMGRQKKYINDWNQENFFKYKSATQAAWMDWVVSGSKYNVDYNFGMVAIDSIMARVEASKESLRNSTIPDADGANEVYGVALTPGRWATYCKRKAEGWYQRNGNYTLGQLDAEIARLSSLLDSYNTTNTKITKSPSEYPVKGATASTTLELEKKKANVTTATNNLYDAQAELADKAKAEAAAKLLIDPAVAKVKAAQKALQDSKIALSQANQEDKDYKMMTLSGTTKTDVQNWIGSKITTINAQIKQLQDLRIAKIKGEPITVPVITGSTAPKDADDKDTANGTTFAGEGDEMAKASFGLNKPPPPAPGTTAAAGGTGQSSDDADPWTTINFAFSATDQKTHSEDDMASCDVSVSFSALVVNINRPWLYGELFQDVDLEVAEGVKISPGPLGLHRLIASQDVATIDQYDQFPAYPTSFIVAADTTIEFSGSTKHIEEHFDSHSNSGSASVGWGPWSASSSFHESGSSSDVQMHTTATGCKLTFGSPQVIAWVSQILPALPRTENYNPLTQGAGKAVPK
ncbi:hypothetical protein BU24DRAFT_386453 [Aaosphaeria arxii CBS 175.79]|uniref:Uncharacterized protein n=1 Tax=Aaosphaeria arxii CBS 175.79 TaxID=1450172 RepID=A0A6A5Y3B1_9PLEO|nr:uncharacterized protein BU24DRAFT_386453 [Aaosphaeria arxii CBS 175.79]KAF2019517.1 hypothetical protein BU24DRAFT_386453 [Aaosphaeria arxii CBS 175.79]